MPLPRTDFEPIEPQETLRMRRARNPAVYLNPTPTLQKSTVDEILGFIGAPTFYAVEMACRLAMCPPAVFETWVEQDASLELKLGHALATQEAYFIGQLRAGGPGFSPAKAALVELERRNKTWQPRGTNLAERFKTALDDLQRLLPADVYETVLKAFDR